MCLIYITFHLSIYFFNLRYFSHFSTIKAKNFISNQGHIEIVTELLKNGADPSIKNNAGNTAFEESLESNNSDELLNILESARPYENSELPA